jgi:hypothetical protein
VHPSSRPAAPEEKLRPSGLSSRQSDDLGPAWVDPRSTSVAGGALEPLVASIAGADDMPELRDILQPPARSNEAREAVAPRQGRTFEGDPVPGPGTPRRIAQGETARILKIVQALLNRTACSQVVWPEDARLKLATLGL